jgi:hypothetical protein
MLAYQQQTRENLKGGRKAIPDRKIRMGFIDLATGNYYSNDGIIVPDEVIRSRD